MHGFVWFLTALALALGSAFGQTTTGDILGTVKDGSGAAIADAKVTVRSLETNIAKEVLTNSEGNYRVPLLSTGSYMN